MHLIQQQYVHVEMNGTESEGLAVQRQLAELCQHWLPAVLERTLERCSPAQAHLYLEHLDLQLGSLDLQRLEHALLEALEQVLETALREKAATAATAGNAKAQLKTPVQATWGAFLHFLQTGQLPWFFRLPPGETLEQAVEQLLLSTEIPAAYKAEVERRLTTKYAQQRFKKQFSPSFQHLLQERTGSLNEPNHQADSAESLSTASTRPDQPEPAAEAIYVDDAGLVLLHPFLPRFFEQLGVVENELLVQPARALALLHYLATGAGTTPEYELGLPKILCGMALETPLGEAVELSETEQAESMALLEAVVQHWQALKHTSPAGLRATFLQRPGKLSRRPPHEWLLQVEQRGPDILLESLPWNMGVLRLPWMPGLLWVEWI
ncbi:contractile injection system tape measure protein [Hymenobacter sp. HDW8]|uniref:contractile injection system tape measure protein n=1 Tax=Hymenobacter sp. HDW8 TaxID=2714932 RepID=UPI001407A3A5|nr:contractile injection system tape measure protein [Hymenobacter sp. HDW8]QIL74990.1 hypothetical protein G7064_03310 [Hymenobacter sp. HDW8]